MPAKIITADITKGLGKSYGYAAGLIILILANLMFSESALAANKNTEATGYSEYSIKGAYLYNFPKFTTWPEGTFKERSSTFTICVLGKNAFGTALNHLATKKIDKRSLQIRYARKVDDVQLCQLVFVSQSEASVVGKVLAALEAQPILTVSDIEGFAEAGGIIELIRENNRISFHVNQKQAEKQGLLISSALLDLASVVIRGDQ